MNSKSEYIASMLLIEKVYKAFLNLVKDELDKIGAFDINNVQCLLLYQIGRNQVNVSDIISKGYYSGSNVSYNLKKMSEASYIEQTQANHDKRASVIKLSAKGLGMVKKLDKIFEKHVSVLKEIKLLASLPSGLDELLKALTTSDLAKRSLFVNQL